MQALKVALIHDCDVSRLLYVMIYNVYIDVRTPQSKQSNRCYGYGMQGAVFNMLFVPLHACHVHNIFGYPALKELLRHIKSHLNPSSIFSTCKQVSCMSTADCLHHSVSWCHHIRLKLHQVQFLDCKLFASSFLYTVSRCVAFVHINKQS